MTHAAHDFLVYACVACEKRIFTKRSHVGRLGTCPCCMVEHRVGGEEVVSAVSAGVERRDAPRVKPVGAKAQIAADHGEQAEVFSLDDLSVTGFSFHLPAVRDGKRITGVAAPMEVGDVFRVGFRAGVTKDAFFYDAEVRRVVASEHGAQYLIGAAFINLSDLQRADLGETVERYL